jgi:hypothetical protein
MKISVLTAAILLPGTLLAAAPAQRHPSGVIVTQSPLRLSLEPIDEANPQWDCGSCREKIHLSGAKGDSFVDHLARFDSVFENVINGAAHHDYKLKLKLYF